MCELNIGIVTTHRAIAVVFESTAKEINCDCKMFLPENDFIESLKKYQPDIILLNLCTPGIDEITDKIISLKKHKDFFLAGFTVGQPSQDLLDKIDGIVEAPFVTNFLKLLDEHTTSSASTKILKETASVSTKNKPESETNEIGYKQKNILLVDDSPLIHKIAGTAIRENNFLLTEAYDGEEAYEMILNKQPDLILTDIEMPKMNGYELCRKVKDNPDLYKIPVIICSTLSSGIDIDKGFDAGANDYLTKPVDIEELLSRINMFLESSEIKIREKILIAEDSDTVRNMILKALQQQGFQTISCVNGQKAYEATLDERPNLIITDLQMPVVNGYEFTKNIRKVNEFKDIPIVMLSSRDSSAEKRKGQSAGSDAYITKPFTPDKLLVIVERLLAEYKLKNQMEIMKMYISEAAVNAAVLAAEGKVTGIKFTAEEKFLTILFIDVVGFTPRCEKYEPIKVVDILNSYLFMMTDILRKNNAIIDKFIGDAIMAIFGKKEDGAYRAVLSAIEMLNALKAFNRTLKEPISVRIGINSGDVILGDIGSINYRRDFTVIGNNVNIAQRLESCAEADSIYISESTYKLVKDVIESEKIKGLSLKGIKNKVDCYKVKSLHLVDEDKILKIV